MSNSKQKILSLTEKDFNKSNSESTSNSSKEESKQQSSQNIITSSGKSFNKARYHQLQKATGATGILAMPHGMYNDGRDGCEYFYASTQYAGQIERKESMGWEKVLVENLEVRHFAGIDKGGQKHEHILMRLKKEDRQILNEIAIEKKKRQVQKEVLGNLDTESVYEKHDRLRTDGEKTLGEELNKYNFNDIKQL